MHIHDVDEDNLRMISSYLHDRVSDAIPLLSTPFSIKKKSYSRKHGDSATRHSPDQIDGQPSIKSSPTILVSYTQKRIDNPAFLTAFDQGTP